MESGADAEICTDRDDSPWALLSRWIPGPGPLDSRAVPFPSPSKEPDWTGPSLSAVCGTLSLFVWVSPFPVSGGALAGPVPGAEWQWAPGLAAGECLEFHVCAAGVPGPVRESDWAWMEHVPELDARAGDKKEDTVKVALTLFMSSIVQL